MKTPKPQSNRRKLKRGNAVLIKDPTAAYGFRIKTLVKKTRASDLRHYKKLKETE